MIAPTNINPPRWPLTLMRLFLKKEFLEEIEGDMEELFRDNVEQFSYKKARRVYVWEMLKLLRPVLLKNLEGVERLNQFGMFKNYFKVSIRGLLKNPMSSFINVFGLALAIGVSIFVYAFARFTFSRDQFHKHKDEVYLVTFYANRDGKAQQHGRTPRPLGEMLRDDFTQIKKVCRVDDRNAVVKLDDKVFRERIRFTDPGFLEMFTFPLKWGVSRSLADVNSVVLSEKMSVKYFGEENPVGQDITILFGKGRSKVFRIGGVAEAFPEARTVSFDFLINFENFLKSEPDYDFHDWTAFVDATLIQVDNPSDLAAVEQGMGKYKVFQNEAVQADWAISSFAFEPLATLHEKAADIRDDISLSSRGEYVSVIYLGFVGAFMLALACFNYINIAIVTAARRLKEIGVRKSIGANRVTVIIQFLSENIVITFFALILGIILGSAIFIPGFERNWNNFSLDFSLYDGNLWMYLGAVLLFTSVASGIYPSLYISSFQVAGIFRGSLAFGQKNPVTKIFLGFQLILACIFLTCAAMFTQNADFLAKRSWGYTQHEALYAVVPDYAAYERLQAMMAKNPDVISLSGSGHHLGKSHTSTVLHFPERDYEVDQLSVDARYFETMGIQLREGRIFNDLEGSDKQSVIINEYMAKDMAWSQAVGQSFMIDSVQYEVVGVVKEFHSYNFARQVRPTIFRVAEQGDYRYLSLKVRRGAEVEVYKSLLANWTELFPEIPFEGGYQEDVWGNYYQQIAFHGTIWRVFAFIAISLAGLGLYGLIKLNVTGRVREFSIRKVLGAGLKNIGVNITRPYVLLFVVALTIGAPVAYTLVKFLLEDAYTYHMPITFSGAIIAVAILILVLLLTVSTQIFHVMRSNAVEGLKTE